MLMSVLPPIVVKPNGLKGGVDMLEFFSMLFQLALMITPVYFFIYFALGGIYGLGRNKEP
jgi:hypothetical protein